MWIAPRQALRDYWEGGLSLVPPQIMSLAHLAHLARFADVAAVMAEARGRAPALIQPEAFAQDGVNKVCYPGDPLHPVALRAMPGPTRLCWRNERYEPEGGLEALLG